MFVFEVKSNNCSLLSKHSTVMLLIRQENTCIFVGRITHASQGILITCLTIINVFL
jgi:hypothetical protein